MTKSWADECFNMNQAFSCILVVASYAEALLIESNNKDQLENIKAECRRSSRMEGLAEPGIKVEFEIY